MTQSSMQEAQVKTTYYAPVFVCGTMGAEQNLSQQSGFVTPVLRSSPVQED